MTINKTATTGKTKQNGRMRRVWGKWAKQERERERERGGGREREIEWVSERRSGSKGGKRWVHGVKRGGRLNSRHPYFCRPTATRRNPVVESDADRRRYILQPKHIRLPIKRVVTKRSKANAMSDKNSAIILWHLDSSPHAHSFFYETMNDLRRCTTHRFGPCIKPKINTRWSGTSPTNKTQTFEEQTTEQTTKGTRHSDTLSSLYHSTSWHNLASALRSPNTFFSHFH